jgi:hypothetical protein
MTNEDQELKELVFAKLNEMEEWLNKNPTKYMSREHFDELLVYIEAKPEAFPRELVGIVESPGSAGPTLSESTKRAYRIMHAMRRLPNQYSSGSTKSDNLLPFFTLDEDEKSRVLELCEKMRKIILSTNAFDEPHKVRLLNRLAAIEREVLKDKGLFDVVRGGMDDLGETLGKFGTNIKPLTDRMKEIVQITRRKSPAYDQIPAPEEVLGLPSPEENDIEESE